MRSRKKNDLISGGAWALNIAIGLIIGIAAGLAQLALLVLFAKRVTRGEGKFLAAGLVQWILPFAAILAVAFLYRPALLWTGVGAASSLIIGAVLKVLIKGGRS
ncbi:MAG: hypothetical protein LBH17_02145 [Oscillospiraceae bacterium]|nr:hypothetical protein [Oscillospiraceae bacterium]